jgi:hypothetical protein
MYILCTLYVLLSYNISIKIPDFEKVTCLMQMLIIIIIMYRPGGSVGIATGYGLDGAGIEFRWGRDFPHLSRTALGPHPASCKWAPGLSRR